MTEHTDHRLKEWIGAAEVTLLDGAGDTAGERFAWLATGLLQRAPERLWDLLKDATPEDLAQVPDAERLLAQLAQRLIATARLQEAGDLVKAASRWQVRLDGAVYRQLAQASAAFGRRVRRRGDDPRAPEAGRRPTPTALRLLYRLLRSAGRSAEAHATLNRLVEPWIHRPPPRRSRTASGAKLGDDGRPPGPDRALSSYVLEPLVPFLDVECRRAGLAPEFYIAPLQPVHAGDPLAGERPVRLRPRVVFVALDLEDLFPAVRGVPSTEELARGQEEIRVKHRRRSCASCARAATPCIVVHELALSRPQPPRHPRQPARRRPRAVDRRT